MVPPPVIRWLAAAAVALTAAGCASSSTETPASASQETFCGMLVAFRASNDSLETDVAGGDTAATQAALQRLVSQAGALDKRAPTDIKPSVATVKVFISELDALFADYDYDLTKLSADPAGVERYTSISDEESNAALDQLRAYGDVDCAALTSTTTAPPAAAIDTTTTATTATTVTPASTIDSTTTVP